ncbi:hypothetical protein TRFO_09232 [Tritrichomonas foetus]|uniref:Ubiquitin-like domain-containing protein n=1 Tax=Tritrichomonas foetus TaxID=1144522 RepID=A0A1J4JKN4_9EUKA|nr:hypothetical protein TRFO_09232 [Tritrichomonas foetus]|eukprot:OHS97812.1 hypothetical protein TRFO_09232 [Tritrichomonas foetus]
MCSQPQLRVRWPDGAFLPIIPPQDATGEDLYKMLRFACGPNQELRLCFNELTIEKDASIKSYGIKSGDTIYAYVFTVPKDNQRMIKSIEGIAREAAKINDIHLNQLEQQIENHPLEPAKHKIIRIKPLPTVLPKKPQEISENPLPTFWKPTKPPDDDKKDQKSGTLPKYSTIEEAGAFFASIGWNQWMW